MTNLPPIRDDLAFLRKTRRPGSIEARMVYGCSCVEDVERTRVWDADNVASWTAQIDLACPAHGRLLEQYLAEVNRALGMPMDGTREAFERVVREHELEVSQRKAQRAQQRSFFARVGDAWRGMVQGWRGGAV